MSPYQFLTQLRETPRPGGDGVRVQVPIIAISDLRTAAGLVLTAATTPAVVAAETNALVVQAAASSNVLGSVTFMVPLSYDSVADELKISVLAQMAGATNTPTLGATVFRKRAGVALSADLAPTASAALSATASTVTINVSKKGLKGGDVLTVNLTSGAHTTDAINVYGVTFQFKSAIVFEDPTIR